MVTVPAQGGNLTEGVIGAPRFVNPILAVSNADKDLTQLIYAGLLTTGKDGTHIPELAESYNISPDGLVYTFTLRNNLTWHDGEPLTSDDVSFTIKTAQEPLVKSAKRANWEGVIVETPDPQTVIFRLAQPFAPFLENATIGILPEHIWGAINLEAFPHSVFNSGAVGAGPYRVSKVANNKNTGVPEHYDLEAFDDYALGVPYIENIRVRFYPNENALVEAYLQGEVESMAALSPSILNNLEITGVKIATAPLPRVFGVFFNQNQASVFSDPNVRLALDAAISRDLITDTVLFGYGSGITGPIPPGSLGYVEGVDEGGATGKERAIRILEDGGWITNKETGVRERKGTPLSFRISTVNAPELKEAVEIIATSWRTIGANVEIDLFELGDLNQNVIRPRKYDALFFGQVLGREPDLFSFWHSSQRNDPGLNVALYTNLGADKLLENARTTVSIDARSKMLEQAAEVIKKDAPAVFVYSPSFLYLIPPSIKNFSMGTVTTASERFLGIHSWYLETERIWQVFAE